MSDYMDTSEAGQRDTFTDFDEKDVTLDVLIRKKTYFDKSLFIKSVFRDQKFLIITAPHCLGKTTALNTFRSFVEIDCDETGTPTRNPIQDTKNYQIFSTKLYNGESLKIMNEKDIVDTHFGKYPVIHLDFRCHCAIESYDQAVEACKDALRKAYKQHAYLFKHPTPKLSASEQKNCEQWCNNTDFVKCDITNGLRELCRYLYKHFGKKVIVLCDDYDSIIMKVLFHGEGQRNLADKIKESLLTATGEQKSQLMRQRLDLKREDLRDITHFSIGILASTLKDGAEYVERAVIMGVSHITAVGISGLNNTCSHTFLDKLAYADYFGLTKDEVEKLCKRYEDVNTISVDDLTDNYNGYTDQNAKCHIYLMRSVLQCINRQKLGTYFSKTDAFERLHFVFQIRYIRLKMMQLVQMKSTTIQVKTKISPDGLKTLQEELLAPERSKSQGPHVFLSFLLEQGYLTYAGTTVGNAIDCHYSVSVKVPNKEVKAILLVKFKSYYTDVCKFDPSLQNICKNSFNDIFTNVENDGFEAAVKVFHKNLETLLQKTLSKETCLKANEETLHTSVCSLFLNCPDTAYCTEFSTDSRSRLDLAIQKGDCGAVFEFKHCTDDLSREATSYNALEEITVKCHHCIFERQDLFQKPPSIVILVGLSINNEKKLSITCQIKGKDEKIHVGLPDRKRKAQNGR